MSAHAATIPKIVNTLGTGPGPHAATEVTNAVAAT